MIALEGAVMPGSREVGIRDVVPALAWSLGIDSLTRAGAPAATALGLDGDVRQVVLVLVDGLGWRNLEARLGHAPTLRRAWGGAVQATTVSPSTTAAAITALATGAEPGETRMVGYSVWRGGEPGNTMNLLTFAPDVDPVAWQARPTLFEQMRDAGVEPAVVSPGKFASSGLTLAALRGGRHVAADTLDQRIAATLRELRAGTRFTYLYWSDIDHTGHHYGAESEQWTGALEAFDAGLAALLRQLPSGVQVVLTADHGMVDIPRDRIIDIAGDAELRDGVRAVAGEARAVHLHAEPGRGDEVVARWADELGDRAWVVPVAELPELIGQGPGAEIVGDAMVFARENWGIVDSRVQSAAAISQVGVHGSLTETEMLTPVIRLA